MSRTLTPAVREKLGIPRAPRPPYRWGFASVVVGLACVPLLLAKLWALCGAIAVVGFVLLPIMHGLENRDAFFREEVYRSGIETTGRVLEIEPPGSGRTDHVVRLEFAVGEAVVRASVVGCPLARRGLTPDDEVVILYLPARPTRCLVTAKINRGA